MIDNRPIRSMLPMSLLMAIVLFVSACAFSGGVEPLEADVASSTTAGGDTATTVPETTTTSSPGTTTTVSTIAPTTSVSTTAAASAACSTDGLAFTLPVEPDLPDLVDQMRRDVAIAAMSCDLEGLAALAEPGEFDHAVAPNSEPDPAVYWQEREEGGWMPLRRLVEVLALPVGVRSIDGVDVFFWPGVAAYDDWLSAPEADRAALQDLFSAEDLERFAADNFYLGSSVAIDITGDWRWYLPGEGN